MDSWSSAAGRRSCCLLVMVSHEKAAALVNKGKVVAVGLKRRPEVGEWEPNKISRYKQNQISP